jgi:hypothetical protein
MRHAVEQLYLMQFSIASWLFYSACTKRRHDMLLPPSLETTTTTKPFFPPTCTPCSPPASGPLTVRQDGSRPLPPDGCYSLLAWRLLLLLLLPCGIGGAAGMNDAIPAAGISFPACLLARLPMWRDDCLPACLLAGGYRVGCQADLFQPYIYN